MRNPVLPLLTGLILIIFFMIPEASSFNTVEPGYYRIEKQQETIDLKQSMERGKVVYNDFCVHCHMADGKGVDKAFPPLAGADYLLEKREASIRAVKYGLMGEIRVNGVTYNSIMPDPGLYEDEVADVMNYVLYSWGNKAKKPVTEREVEKISK